MTNDIVEMLHEAIKRAKNRGACEYVKDGAPCCVIGQFGTLLGIPLDILENGTPKEIYELTVTVNDLNGLGVDRRTIFRNCGAPMKLLTRLQSIWDSGACDRWKLNGWASSQEEWEERGRKEMLHCLNTFTL